MCTLGLEVVKVFQGKWAKGKEQTPLQSTPAPPPNKTYHSPKVHQGAVFVIGDGATYYYG